MIVRFKRSDMSNLSDLLIPVVRALWTPSMSCSPIDYSPRPSLHQELSHQPPARSDQRLKECCISIASWYHMWAILASLQDLSCFAFIRPKQSRPMNADPCLIQSRVLCDPLLYLVWTSPIPATESSEESLQPMQDLHDLYANWVPFAKLCK